MSHCNDNNYRNEFESDGDDELDPDTEELKDAHEICVGTQCVMAKDLLAEAGYKFRIVRINGRECITTRDFCPNRVNVAVIDGVVTSIVGIG